MDSEILWLLKAIFWCLHHGDCMEYPPCWWCWGHIIWEWLKKCNQSSLLLLICLGCFPGLNICAGTGYRGPLVHRPDLLRSHIIIDAKILFLWACHAAVSVLSRCWDLESAWSLISLISVLGPRFCLEFRIVDIGAWTTSLPGVSYR